MWRLRSVLQAFDIKPKIWLRFWGLALAGGLAISPPAQACAIADAAPPVKEEKPQISAKQAEEIFHKLDEVLKFVSSDSKLPIAHPVKRKLSNRDQVEHNLTERLKNDKDAKRLERSEVVLKKFGLIPREFDLRGYFVKTMREQVAGYYNIDDKTVYMMDWIPVEQQMPVMAHELTHALQDQSVDLDKWMKGRAGNPGAGTGEQGAPTLNEGAAAPKESEKTLEPNLEISQDEEQTARQAVVEGQGMVVMVDYLLKDSNQTAVSSPFIVEALKQSMRDSKEYPMYSNAPLYLRESLSFPYQYGMDFVRDMLIRGGKDLAYSGVLKKPPTTTRQVMEPRTYWKGEALPPMRLPAMAKLLVKNYERYDVGAVGEFDVMVLLQQFSGEKVADKLYPEWRGGAYYAAKIADPATGKKADDAKDNTSQIALLYLSRWATPEAAKKFAAEYGNALLKRYKFAQSVLAEGVDEKTAAQLPGKRWLTDEGTVLVECHGNSVLALESFDASTMENLSKQVFESEATVTAATSPNPNAAAAR